MERCLDILKSNVHSNFFSEIYSCFLEYLNQDVSVVYHYTSEETLKKILESSSIRFSNINYLNDKLEFSYFYLFLQNLIDGYSYKYSKVLCDKLDEICMEYCEVGPYIVDVNASLNKNRQCYIASFSCEDDLLSLWTLYIKDAGFMGANFGIKPRNISIYDLDGSIASGLVFYSVEKQEEILNYLMSSINFYYEKCTKKMEFLYGLRELFYKIAPFFKHPAFEQEKEYRFIYYPNNYSNIQKLNDKPVFDIPFNRENDLVSIRLSPTNSSQDDLRRIRKILKIYNMPHIKLSSSNIPFVNR